MLARTGGEPERPVTLWAVPRETTAVQHRGSRSYAEQLSRTRDAASTPVEPRGREPCRPDVLVTEQGLHRADVLPRFESMRRPGMPQGMAGGRWGAARLASSAMDSPLEHRCVGMMPPDDARARVACEPGGRPHVWPYPVAMGMGRGTLQSVGERDGPMACRQITRVPVLDALARLLSRGGDGLRHHGAALLLALAIPHHDGRGGTIQVCDAQTQPLQQAEPGTGEHGAHAPGDPGELAQHLCHVVLG
jgi:hypothetical protein